MSKAKKAALPSTKRASSRANGESTQNSQKKRARSTNDEPVKLPKKAKKEEIKQEDVDTALNTVLPSLEEKYDRSKSEGTTPADIPIKEPASVLASRKLAAYTATASKSPFPKFPHPTPAEAKLAHTILARIHGARIRPDKVVASKDRAGCGDSPSVLDALVRTILSQNTSDVNSTRAKRSMDAEYGGSDQWDEIVAGGEEKLEEVIRSGGLSKTKSRVIMSILTSTKERYGEYSLDHLFKASDEEAMHEMLGLKGVGPKTASCVLLFCLQRQSFAVDTHVHRISGFLGWRPAKATRDETHAHLDLRIPDEDKYGLHVLMVTHGKTCEECKAGGTSTGKCELRKAFRKASRVDE
jgi:endonuclease III